MAPVARHRERRTVFLTGYTTNRDTSIPRTPWYVTSPEEITDDYWRKQKRKSVKLLPVTNFDHKTIYRRPVYVSGEVAGNNTLTHAPAEPSFTPTIGSYYAARGTSQRNAENAAYVVKLLASTHPFRPEYSVPTALAELLDIGSLFKITAKSFSELAGTSYLYYRFGIVQFVQDIKTLSSITKALESRIKEFDSLSKQGGTRRNIKLDGLGQSGKYASDETIFSTYGATVRADKSYYNYYEVRGSVRWRWKNGVTVNLSKLEAFNLAVLKVFDLGELDAATIWNSIPWTWLADYFIDIGNFLQSIGDDNLVEPYDICITRRCKSTNTFYVSYKSSWIRTYGNGKYTIELTSRDADLVIPALPPLRYGLISKTQYLTLLALYGKFRGGSYS